MFCEKPVGGTPEQTVRAERAARRAGVISGVGYNYRWAPLVRYAADLIARGDLGEITNYRGRFFSMYGADPLGLLSWRFKLDEGGYGVTSDLLSHAVDLAHMLLGPITRVVGQTATFIPERPLPRAGGAGHYGRGAPGDPTGAVTNEDYAGMLCEFASGVRGSFEASRTIVGPESQMAFDVHGTKRRAGLEPREAQRAAALPAHRRPRRGYTTVFGGDRFPYHGHFVPGSANGIGFEDLVVIEDYEFMRAVAEERRSRPRVRRRAGVGERAGRAAALGRVGPLGGRRLAQGGIDDRHDRSPSHSAIGVIGVGPHRAHARRAARARGRRRRRGRRARTRYAPAASAVARRARTCRVADERRGDAGRRRRRRRRDLLASTATHADADRRRRARPGKAIFCEKPVSLDLAEVDRALGAVREAGVPFQIGFNRRFDPGHQAVADAVARGEIGDVAPRAHLQPGPGAAADGVRRARRAGSSST